ncbi:hypothetical protein FDECE_16263 [Fusarium decemcellulare]|nr:hypothetical protein FDECE_16263 [Fusarium decemcellulare]
MSEQSTEWVPKIEMGQGMIKVDDLEITFYRTVRVPDDTEPYDHPVNQGSFGLLDEFKLYKVSDYVKKLQPIMARKGGFFFGMYQCEALWIKFNCDKNAGKRYAIKIYAGDINVISGESAVETAATVQRRRDLLKEGKSIQDYITVPGQFCLDGAAVEPGKVRRFTAVPYGPDHLTQIKEEVAMTNLQFEITRINMPPYQEKPGPKFDIKYRFNVMRGQPPWETTIAVQAQDTVGEVLRLVENKGDQGFVLQPKSFSYNGVDMQENRTLADYGITGEGAVLEPGSAAGHNAELGINLVKGGLIAQKIWKLRMGPYQKTNTMTFNVQILNKPSFQMVVGHAPPRFPMGPVSTQTYANWGFPFLPHFEEPTTLPRGWHTVRSLFRIVSRDDPPDEDDWWSLTDAEAEQVAILNPRGPKRPFKFAWEIAEEINQTAAMY